MKILFGIIMVLLLFGAQLTAQVNSVVKIDSIANSGTEIYYCDLENLAPFDSIVYSVYAMGEIDIDSLDVQGGFDFHPVTYKGSDVTGINIYEALEGATLTINNADGTATYVEGATTITKAEAKGYNRLKVTITAGSSGNDATDTYQKVIIVQTVY